MSEPENGAVTNEDSIAGNTMPVKESVAKTKKSRKSNGSTKRRSKGGGVSVNGIAADSHEAAQETPQENGTETLVSTKSKAKAIKPSTPALAAAEDIPPRTPHEAILPPIRKPLLARGGTIPARTQPEVILPPIRKPLPPHGSMSSLNSQYKAILPPSRETPRPLGSTIALHETEGTNSKPKGHRKTLSRSESSHNAQNLLHMLKTPQPATSKSVYDAPSDAEDAPTKTESDDDRVEAGVQLRKLPFASSNSVVPERLEPDSARPPSKKASSKRKFSGSSQAPAKKPRRNKNNVDTTKSSSNFGFESTNGNRSSSRPSTSGMDLDLGKLVNNIYAEVGDADDSPPSRRESVLPRFNEQRRPTPKFTPINPTQRKSQPILPGSQSSVRTQAEVVIPPPSPDNQRLMAAFKAKDSKAKPELNSKSKSKSKPKSKAKTPAPIRQAQDEVESDNAPDLQPGNVLEGNAEDEAEPEPEQPSRPNQGEQRASQKSKSKSNSKSKSKSPAPLSSKRPQIQEEVESDDASEFKPDQTLEKHPEEPRARGPNSAISTGVLEQIKADVESYRDQNDMTQFDLNELIHGEVTDEGQRFWAYMLEEYPDYDRKKLKNICKRNFYNCKRGPFDAEEVETLKDLYERYPNKWKNIAGAMNRFPDDLRTYWKNYVLCEGTGKKGVWTTEEEEKLRGIIHDMLQKLHELKELVKRSDRRIANKTEEELLDWKLVSEKMGLTRSRIQCLQKWATLRDREASDGDYPELTTPIYKSHHGIPAALETARAMTPQQKLELLYAIRESGAGREGKIPWQKWIKPKFNIKIMVLKICFRNLKEQVDGYEEMKFKDILETLIYTFEVAAPDEPEEFDVTLWRVDSVTQKGHEREEQKNKQLKVYPSEKFVESDDSDDLQEESSGARGKFSVKKSKSGVDVPADLDVESESELEEASAQRPLHRKKSRASRAAVEQLEAAADLDESQESATEVPHKHKKKSKSKSKIDVPEDPIGESELEEAPTPRPSHKKKSKSKAQKIDTPEESEVEPNSDEAPSSSQYRRPTKSTPASIGHTSKALEIVEAPELEVTTALRRKKSKSKASVAKTKPSLAAEASQSPLNVQETQENSTEKPKKRKRKSKSILSAAEENEGLEMEIAEQPAKRKRKSVHRASFVNSLEAIAADERDEQDNEERPVSTWVAKLTPATVEPTEPAAQFQGLVVTPRSKRLHKYSSEFRKSLTHTPTQPAVPETEDAETAQAESVGRKKLSSKKKKKLRDSMKLSDESQSQEPDQDKPNENFAEDIAQSFKGMRNGCASKHAPANVDRSEERVIESDDESIDASAALQIKRNALRGSKISKAQKSIPRPSVNVTASQEMWQMLGGRDRVAITPKSKQKPIIPVREADEVSSYSGDENTPVQPQDESNSEIPESENGGEGWNNPSGNEDRNGDEDAMDLDRDDEAQYTLSGGPEPIGTASYSSTNDMEVEESSQLGREESRSVDLDTNDEERTVTMNGFGMNRDEDNESLDTPREVDEVPESEDPQLSSDESEEDIPAVLGGFRAESEEL